MQIDVTTQMTTINARSNTATLDQSQHYQEHINKLIKGCRHKEHDNAVSS